jgi:integrase
MAETDALTDAIDRRWRAMVLLAYCCGLRIDELRGLRRRDIDLLHGRVDLCEQVVDIGGRFVTGPSKTDAGRRRVAIPPRNRDDVARHLAEFVRTDVDAFVFTGHLGEGPVATATWLRSWSAARNATGLRHLHFRDLRHAGNTLARPQGRAPESSWRAWVTPARELRSSTSTSPPIATRPSRLLCRIPPPKQSSRESSRAMENV